MLYRQSISWGREKSRASPQARERDNESPPLSAIVPTKSQRVQGGQASGILNMNFVQACLWSCFPRYFTQLFFLRGFAIYLTGPVGKQSKVLLCSADPQNCVSVIFLFSIHPGGNSCFFSLEEITFPSCFCLIQCDCLRILSFKPSLWSFKA